MEPFEFYKKQESVWRDEDGNIRCLGDACPQTCEDACPIWFHTMGISMLQMGLEKDAIEYFQNAISIAPDYKEAWNNLAACYGQINNHLEANKAYRIAYSLDNNYEKALWGLIISCKNLGQFDEAMKYCDDYAHLVNESEADRLRKRVIEARDSGEIVRQESALDMALKIIEHAQEVGLLSNNKQLHFIPELFKEAKPVCRKVFDETIKLEDGRHIWTWLSWGAYAGMGAVIHWHISWNKLKEKGIAETLLEPRGAFAMDEYVIDTIGLGFETDEGKKLSKDIFDLSMWACMKFIQDPSKKESAQIVFEAMQAMYIFGMRYEMERLGMK